MDECARVLAEKQESELDIFLVSQARYHVIMNEMTPSPADFTNGDATKIQPPDVVMSMQMQVQNIYHSLSLDKRSSSMACIWR